MECEEGARKIHFEGLRHSRLYVFDNLYLLRHCPCQSVSKRLDGQVLLGPLHDDSHLIAYVYHALQ